MKTNMPSVGAFVIALTLSALVGGTTSGDSTLGQQASGLEPPPPATEAAGPSDLAAIRGVVHGSMGPLSGAFVSVDGARAVRTDATGRFAVTSLSPGAPLAVSAWAMGYFIADAGVHMPGPKRIEIKLTPLAVGDNSSYEWVSGHTDSGDQLSCERCHGDLAFDEWRDTAHAQSALNPRFLTLYAGTDVHGNKSPPTRFVGTRDYPQVLKPDRRKPYFGPGFLLDWPNIRGDCAACHVPVAAVGNAFAVDPLDIDSTAREGISCDFCHKISGVRLDPDTGLPFPKTPGVLSYQFLRPPDGHQIFTTALDMLPSGGTTVSILGRSEFCAPCHHGVFRDTVVYNSFGEWLHSPYSDPVNGKSCQDCHMPPSGNRHFVPEDLGGRARDPSTVFTHALPAGATDRGALNNSVLMSVTGSRQGSRIVVDVEITNDRVGHRVPTGTPLRHLILVVRTIDEQGEALPQTDGPVLPPWTGEGNTQDGCYSGLAGKVFAKVLRNVWTDTWPTAQYWNPTTIISDNRIEPFATDRSAYAFAAPSTGQTTIDVTLIYRRAFHELAAQKGWSLDDIVMEREIVTLGAK